MSGKFHWKMFGAVIAALIHSIALSQNVRIANVIELSGPGASAGVQWRDAAELAKDEINKSGGILGRQVELMHFDTQTNPGVSRSQMLKALEEKPYVVLGTIYSGSTKVNMELTRQAEVPQIVGAQGADLTQVGNPYLFRANLGQQFGIPKVVTYLKDTIKARSVSVVWVNDDFGKGGRKEFVAAAAAQGLKLGADVSTDANQIDFTAAVLAAKNAGSDAVFVYLHEEESARFLIAARKLGLETPMVGETTLLSQKVIDLAGSAVNGVRGFIPLTADAPVPAVKKFRMDFEKRFNYTPAHAGMQGYLAMYVIKAVAEANGNFDSKAFAKRLHGMTISAEKYPGVLMDTRWDENGDVDRQTFMAEVVNGKQVISQTILPAWQKK